MSLKLLVISDIHGEKKSLNRIKAAYHNHDPDLTVVCGDITHFGNKNDAVDYLEKIPTDTIGVVGNCDPKGVEDAYKEVSARYLHLNPVKIEGIEFVGISGSNYSKEDLDKFEKLSTDSDVFVLHQPAYGYLDKASREKNIGNQDLLSIIDINDPKLVLSGHVHEDRGIIEEQDTVYLNPGPAHNDNLAIVEISKNGIRAILI